MQASDMRAVLPTVIVTGNQSNRLLGQGDRSDGPVELAGATDPPHGDTLGYSTSGRLDCGLCPLADSPSKGAECWRPGGLAGRIGAKPPPYQTVLRQAFPKHPLKPRGIGGGVALHEAAGEVSPALPRPKALMPVRGGPGEGFDAARPRPVPGHEGASGIRRTPRIRRAAAPSR